MVPGPYTGAPGEFWQFCQFWQRVAQPNTQSGADFGNDPAGSQAEDEGCPRVMSGRLSRPTMLSLAFATG